MMEMEFVGDVATVDPELLQLPDVSSFALKSNPYIADELFGQWLSLPDTGRLVFCSISSFISVPFIGFCSSCWIFIYVGLSSSAVCLPLLDGHLYKFFVFCYKLGELMMIIISLFLAFNFDL